MERRLGPTPRSQLLQTELPTQETTVRDVGNTSAHLREGEPGRDQDHGGGPCVPRHAGSGPSRTPPSQRALSAGERPTCPCHSWEVTH